MDKVCVRNLPAVAVACESEPNRSQYVAQHAARRQDPRRSSDIDPTGTHQSIDSSVSQRARIDPVGQQSIGRSVLSQRGGGAETSQKRTDMDRGLVLLLKYHFRLSG